MKNETKKNKKTSTVAKTTAKAKSTAGAKKTANKKPATKPAKQTKTAPKAKATKPAKKVETKKAIKRAETKSNKKQAVKTTALPSKKLQRAEELRRKNYNAIMSLYRIHTNWEKALKNAKTSKEKKEVDKKYEAKFNEADKQELVSYKKYYDYVKNNFSQKTREEAFAKCNVITSKRFINALGRNK